MARAVQLLMVSVVAGILCGCGKEEEVQVPAEEVSFTDSPPPPAATATPPPATMATPPPPSRRLLPDGEFVLVKRASVVTDTGVFGAGPGTKVKLVRKSGSKLIVSNGSGEFEVAETDLTNDLDVIESLNAQNLPPASSGPAQTSAPPASTPRPAPPRPAVSTPDPKIAAQAAQRDRITAQIAALNRAIAGYNERLNYLNEQQYKGLKSAYGSARANALARDRKTPEESRISSLLQKAEAQREALKEQLRSMR